MKKEKLFSVKYRGNYGFAWQAVKANDVVSAENKFLEHRPRLTKRNLCGEVEEIGTDNANYSRYKSQSI